MCWVPTSVLAVLWSAPTPPPPDGVIIKFADTASQTSRAHALSSAGLKPIKTFQLVKGLTFARPVPGQSLDNTVSTLAINPNIEYVEPNYYVAIDIIPNDPNFHLQYGLHNDGTNGGLANADIDAPEAWDVQTGNGVVIAVIDTGVDYTHPDLKDNIWVNPGEIAGNGIDDDGNGFVDDIHGWDFASDINDPADDHAHGTHVAGIIAAKSNNGIGVSGINWNAKIMALKFFDANGLGSTSNAIRAINYAVMMGVRISNNSWGGGGFSKALFDTIQAAAAKGHLFVAASGNETLNTDTSPHYPSAYDLPNIISVAATDDSDRLASFSNFGVVTVDIAAPGFRIESLIPNGLYQSLSGTSMAAPFVSGAAGLVLSTVSGISTEALKAALLDNADLLPSLSGRVATGARLNISRTLKSLVASASITPNTTTMGVNESVSFRVSGGTAPFSWSVANANIGQISSSTGLFTALAVGRTQVSVTDANGLTARTGDIVVEALDIKPSSATIIAGQTLQFSVSGGTPPYAWSSSDLTAGSIDAVSGVFQANVPARVTVSVTDSSGVSALSGNINIVPVPSLSISPMFMMLQPNDTLPFSIDGGAPPYQWSVSDPFVATIDNTGDLVALEVGITTVTATDAVGNSVTTGSIEVQGGSMQILPVDNNLAINGILQVKAEGGVPPYQWRVTDSSVASIDNQGQLVGKSPGKVVVRIMDAMGEKATSNAIVVTESTILTINPENALLIPGESILVLASGGTPPYTLEVSNTAVTEFNEVSKLLTAVGVGMSSVVVTDGAGEKYQSGIFEVRDITATPDTGSLVVGESLQFSASGGIAPYSWSVNTSSVAKIDANSGFVMTFAPGAFIVTATDAEGVDGKTSAITVGTASANANDHVMKILPNTVVVSRRGKGIQFIANGGIEPYTFSLSNPDTGAINPNSGQFTPNSSLTSTTTSTVIVVDGDGHVAESGILSVQ